MVPGQIVDQRFVLDRLVARGGMGSVYRAHDQQTGARIAFKVWNGVGDNSDRFEREARVLERLDHEAIVRYVAHGATSEGELYLAMEWLEGIDLAARLATDGVTIAESVTAIARAAEGLAIAHAMGVVHRDLKPSNLFLVDGDPGKLKVLDFGVARFREVDGNRPETHGGVVLGTPDYMAPEQARGEKTIDARADVFALGAVLFECLTGRGAFSANDLGAFSANDLVAVLARVMLEEVPRVRTLRPEVPAALDELVARMLEKSPASRPASAAEVAATLRSLSPIERDCDDVVSSRPRAPALRRELQLVSVVAVRAGATVDARSAAHTLAAGSAPGVRSRQARVARAFGVRTSALDDGTTAFIVRHGPAIDRAPHAARCALALDAGRGEVPMVVVSGTCVLEGDRLDPTELVGRAHSLLPAVSGPIRIDDLTRALLDLRFDVERTGDGWVLRHARDGRDDLRNDLRTRISPPLPFVGRSRELAVVDALREECERESIARVLLLTGPAGIGKSRLCAEVLAHLRGDKISARGEATTCASPLSLVRMLARSASLDGEAPEVERSLRTLLQQSRRPMTLVLDDLHHADFPSIQALERILRELRDRPLLLVAFARPELSRVFPACFLERGRQELPLGELPRSAIAELARGVWGARADETAIAHAAARCEGNPMILEALLAGDEATATMVGRFVAQGRLDALDGDARRVVRLASALPEPFTATILREVSASTSELEVILGELVDSGLLGLWSDGDVDGGERRFAFHSRLVREAAAAMLPEDDRAFVARAIDRGVRA